MLQQGTMGNGQHDGSSSIDDDAPLLCIVKSAIVAQHQCHGSCISLCSLLRRGFEYLCTEEQQQQQQQASEQDSYASQPTTFWP
jgi:hypothetical protein